MVGFVVLGILWAEVHVLIKGFGPILGGLLSIPATVLTLAAMLLVAYCHGCIERFLKRRRDRAIDGNPS